MKSGGIHSDHSSEPMSLIICCITNNRLHFVQVSCEASQLYVLTIVYEPCICVAPFAVWQLDIPICVQEYVERM